jgi:hypothetical protein
MNHILSPEEIVFLKKLCRPAPFTPTFPEQVMLELFLKEKIVKRHRDGSVEVTEHGADCYAATLNMAGN